MLNNSFFPAQPALRKITSSYVEARPNLTATLKNIAVYYEFTIDKSSTLPIFLVPDGCFDLLFHLTPLYAKAYLWTTPFSKKEQTFLNQEGFYFGVRFWPEQNLIFFHEHMKELIEKIIPLQDVLSFDEQIFETLITAKDFNHRIKIIDHFLTSIQQEPLHETLIIKHIISKIYQFKGECSLEMAANSTGYSQQYIRRIFERYIGLSPKQFAQIIQLQQILQIIDYNQNIKLQDLALDAGFYDQAHFTKTFKKLMLTTPKNYLKQTNVLFKS